MHLNAQQYLYFGESRRTPAGRIANDLTRSYVTTRTLLNVWSTGGIAAADAVMLDASIGLHDTEDATRGFLNIAKAFDEDKAPPEMTFAGNNANDIGPCAISTHGPMRKAVRT